MNFMDKVFLEADFDFKKSVSLGLVGKKELDKAIKTNSNKISVSKIVGVN